MTAPFPSIDGFDLEDARQRIEDRDLLVELLLEFRTRWGSGGDRIAAALAAGDRQGAERLAHALNGVASTLALVDVHHAASRIETILGGDHSTPADGDVRALCAALSRVASAIDAAFGGASGGGASGGGASGGGASGGGASGGGASG